MLPAKMLHVEPPAGLRSIAGSTEG